jgi:hypothetical protein
VDIAGQKIFLDGNLDIAWVGVAFRGHGEPSSNSIHEPLIHGGEEHFLITWS